MKAPAGILGALLLLLPGSGLAAADPLLDDSLVEDAVDSGPAPRLGGMGAVDVPSPGGSTRDLVSPVADDGRSPSAGGPRPPPLA